MIRFVSGDIFKSDADALVNTVNTVGVMGKGVALQFKERFEENYKLYHVAAKKAEIEIGRMFVTPTHRMQHPFWIINFPTKKHWMHASSYDYIEAGLNDLVRVINELHINSIALPPLGTGQGGLKWEKVKLLIEEKLNNVAADIIVYEPGTSQTIIATAKNPVLTISRALILSLANKYRVLGYDLSFLEMQKLAYFLQRVGQKSLKLNFKKYHYGPYAHNLQHLLHAMEGYYITTAQSVLDSKPLDTLCLESSRMPEVEAYLLKNCSSDDKKQLTLVADIMRGFESPFGLELLATVDWIIKDNPSTQSLSAEEVKEHISAWSARKDVSFSLWHINSAINHLHKFEGQLGYSVSRA